MTPPTDNTAAPGGEQGYAAWNGVNLGKFASWTSFIDMTERVPKLAFPQSVETYKRMRADPKVQGTYMACTEPVIRYTWALDRNGARDEVLYPLADDLGLPIQGEEARPRLRNAGRFNHEQHMRNALLALLYGFNMFEIVGAPPASANDLWRLTKLGVRPPDTIGRISVDEHGGLIGIKQRQSIADSEIPASKLVPFVWNMEGGNWYGRSLLRSVYQPWMIKDRVIRVVATMHERNGMGLPKIKRPEGSGPDGEARAQAIGSGIRSGEQAYVDVPDGWDVTLEGVRGTLPDGVKFLDYLDQQISTATLTFFADLGRTKSGSRALGSEFIDFFMLAQETTGLWYASTMNDGVIERWVDINFGPDEPAPRLVFQRNEDPNLAVAPLVSLIESGAVTLDASLENQIRSRFGLPMRDAGDPAPEVRTAPPSPLAPTSLASAATEPLRAAAGPVLPDPLTGKANGVPIPSSGVRRQPNELEQQSHVDLRKLDAEWQKALAALALLWQGVNRRQSDELEQMVRGSDSPADLGTLAASTAGVDDLTSAMQRMWHVGVDSARSELTAQGATTPQPDPSSALARIAEVVTAVTALLTRSISNSAAAAALRRTGGTLTPSERAQQVREHLDSLTYADQRTTLGGALSTALHVGRTDVFASAPAGTEYAASELLDNNTCTPCIGVDGTIYATLDDALNDYPAGGFTDCEGRDRCRGTVVALVGGARGTAEDES